MAAFADVVGMLERWGLLLMRRKFDIGKFAVFLACRLYPTASTMVTCREADDRYKSITLNQ